MLNIYLVRHGETEWNKENRLQGWQDSPLTERGVNNALLLGARLKSIVFSKVFSSPTQRALNTAKLISSDEIVVIEDLKEISFGGWEGKTQGEIEKDSYQEYFNFWSNPHEYNHVPHQGESIRDFMLRTKQAMKSIVDSTQNGNILIVTHGATIKAIMSYFWEIPLEKFWEPPIIQGASLSLIKWDGKVFHKELLGDTAHME
ncbi:histidine phosphatase family protein [Bacillus sp. NTK074B]|uniref:histidine phosphatase family protein n=1 Tax=Bacillus sp. NTK074B TaxID=2802174 RepID=UPI001A8E3FB7|nr:histidine phosphatase family protein [Bacillus sp. NTK074B]